MRRVCCCQQAWAGSGPAATVCVACARVQGRTPLDLLAKELRRLLPQPHDLSPADADAVPGSSSSSSALATCAWAWGSGANYQLGTGLTEFAEAPVRLEALAGVVLVAVAAAKYHSAALSEQGQMYCWGWGRGGRTGHPDCHIHSGERALIQPWQVREGERQRE